MEDSSVDLARVDRCEVEGEGGKGVSTMIRIDAKTDTYWGWFFFLVMLFLGDDW